MSCSCPTDPDDEHDPGDPISTCAVHGWAKLDLHDPLQHEIPKRFRIDHLVDTLPQRLAPSITSPSGGLFQEMARRHEPPTLTLDELYDTARRLEQEYRRDPIGAQLTVAGIPVYTSPLVPEGQAWIVPDPKYPVRHIAYMNRKDAQTVRPPHPLMRLFQYDHLPEHLQAVFQPFSRLAHETSQAWHDWDDPALTWFMMKLWEAKNLAVAAVARPNPAPEEFTG